MSETEQVQISRIYKLDGESKLKAFVDISLGGLVVKGLRIVEGQNGLFVSMPRHQGKDGRWYNTVYPTTKEVQKELTQLVLSAYDEQ
jgi:stage V sporulation protein G